MKLLLIVNTSASSVTHRARVVINKALSSGHSVTLRETNRRGHAARLAQGAAADGAEVVLVLGGDGTLNEAANGLAGTDVALGALPGGSTNVFARSIGMSNDVLEATNQVLGALASGSVKKVGLGMANDRYFLFHVGIGFDAAVVYRVEKLAPLKRYTGPLVFVMAALSTWARGYDRRRPHFDVSTARGLTEGCYFSVCLNTGPYTYCGPKPLNLAPEAGLDRQLSLVSFTQLRLGPVLSAARSAFGDGSGVAAAPHVSSLSDLSGATVTAREPVPYQLDGDYVGEAGAIDISWQPEALSLVLPITA